MDAAPRALASPPEPSPAQAARVLAVADLVEALLPDAQELSQRHGHHYQYVTWESPYRSRTQEWIQDLLPRLLEHLGTAAPDALADYLCFPTVPQTETREPVGRQQQILGYAAATKYFQEHPHAYASGMLLNRARALLDLGSSWQERPTDDQAWQEYQRGLDLFVNGRRLSDPDRPPAHFRPYLTDCVGLLLQGPDSEELLALLAHLVEGRWPVAMPHDRYATDVLDWRRIAFRLYAHGRIHEAGLDRAVARIGFGVNHRGLLEIAVKAGSWYHPASAPASVVAAVEAWSFRTLDHYLSALDPDQDALDYTLCNRYGSVHDYRWLLAVLRQYQRRGIDTPAWRAERKKPPMFQYLARLLRLDKYRPEQTEDEFVAALGGFSQAVLLNGLTDARGVARRAFLRALGWDDLLPWLDFEPRRQAIENGLPEPAAVAPAGGSSAGTDTGTGAAIATTPAAEAIDGSGLSQPFPREQMRALFAATDPTHRALYQQYAEPQAFTVYEALEGTNRAALLKSIGHGSHASIRLYGLLPAPDQDAVLDAYLLLRRVYKEARQYGAERAANTRKAALTGIANLAVTAGYAEPSELEWDMESRVADAGLAAQAPQAVGDWWVELVVEEALPRIVVTKGGKRLASVPPAVRKSAPYLALRDQQEQMQEQAQRFRLGLERLMVDQRPITAERYGQLRRIPAAWGSLRQLILRGADGALGRPEADGARLQPLDGPPVPLAWPATIAHVHDLFAAGQLAGWQRRIAEARQVQPFKQAFRELYILTPAEQQAGFESQRFAGHPVRGATAARLLSQRGWRVAGSEEGLCTRFEPSSGLCACFEFEGIDHYMGESGEPLSSGRLSFTRGDATPRYVYPRDPLKAPVPLALADVPPVLFSETFRDADLVVSVAQVTEAASAAPVSAETYIARADVVRAVAQALRLDTVRCEGHFAYVRGRRAEYRVHLGSGAIHILPGNYLRIVPEPGGSARAKIYLPFADTERKLGEIVSKLLLLTRDDAIDDPSITRQIDAALGKA